MVEGARESHLAIDWIESLATSARDISSRSASVNANPERCLCGGRTCLSEPESLVPTSGSDQKAGRSSEEICPPANVPASALSASRCNKSGVAVSSATLPRLAQSLVCCIHRLNPPALADVRPLTLLCPLTASDQFFVDDRGERLLSSSANVYFRPIHNLGVALPMSRFPIQRRPSAPAVSRVIGVNVVSRVASSTGMSTITS